MSAHAVTDGARLEHVRASARAFFASALQSEGLRLKDPIDTTRMADLAVKAGLEIEAALDLTGPKGGPTHTPAGTSREQEAAPAAGNSECVPAGSGGAEVELGSITSGGGGAERGPYLGDPCGACGHSCNWHNRRRQGCSFDSCSCVNFAVRADETRAQPSLDDKRTAAETGSMAPATESGSYSVGPTGFCGAGVDGRIGITAVKGRRGIQIFSVGGSLGNEGPWASHVVAAQVVDELNARDAERAAAVRRADVIAAERDDAVADASGTRKRFETLDARLRTAVAKRDEAQDSLRSSELKRRALESALNEWGAAADAVGLPEGSAPSDRLKVLPGATEVESIHRAPLSDPLVTRRDLAEMLFAQSRAEPLHYEQMIERLSRGEHQSEDAGSIASEGVNRG